MKPSRTRTALGIAAWLCGGATVASLAWGSGSFETWRFPGDYESHQAMWMMWQTFDYKAGFPPGEVQADMIRAMSGHTHVNLGVQNEEDELAARKFLRARGVPLGHVHFFDIEHGDIWARDMGPQFTKSSRGNLRINDWNFNMWGHEEPDSDSSTLEENVDRLVSRAIRVPALDTQVGPGGVRMIHEGGSPTHSGHGTAILATSVSMQRNMGPGRFCGGPAPITDYGDPSTYVQNEDWFKCRALIEKEYTRMLGTKKFIWVPTGMVEDNGTFRGPLHTEIQVDQIDGKPVPHSGVYTTFTTNGHLDEAVRFVAPDKVVLAEEIIPTEPPTTPLEKLRRELQMDNKQRLDRIYDIVSHETNESGEPIEIVRIPTPVLTFELFEEGDGTFDYFADYDRWEDGSSVPAQGMLAVWASSYVNYLATNNVVMVSRFWKPGRSLEIKRRDEKARQVMQQLFPGSDVVPIYSENINRGGGGMHCIAQQQPASDRFAELCGWAKVRADKGLTQLYRFSLGSAAFGPVGRMSLSGDNVYLKRFDSDHGRILVKVVGNSWLEGFTGWVDEDEVESAGEQCPSAYSLR